MAKTSFDLDADVKKELDIYCVRHNKKKKDVVNDSLRKFLKNDMTNKELFEKIKDEIHKM